MHVDCILCAVSHQAETVVNKSTPFNGHELNEANQPVIVKVFPEPVCPYAMMVPLYPSKTDVTISLAHICKCTCNSMA